MIDFIFNPIIANVKAWRAIIARCPTHVFSTLKCVVSPLNVPFLG